MAATSPAAARRRRATPTRSPAAQVAAWRAKPSAHRRRAPRATISAGSTASTPAAMYRYDAGTSGSGTWSTLAASRRVHAARARAYDGAGHVVAFSRHGGAELRHRECAPGRTLPNRTAHPSAARRSARTDSSIAFSGTNVLHVRSGKRDDQHSRLCSIKTTPARPSLTRERRLSSTSSAVRRRLGRSSASTRARRRRSRRASPARQLARPCRRARPWNYHNRRERKTASDVTRSCAVRRHDDRRRRPAWSTWTPTLAQVGAQIALVRASNSAGTAEQLITFNVLAVAAGHHAADRADESRRVQHHRHQRGHFVEPHRPTTSA